MNWMLLVPWPEVIVPFVMLQEYVAPFPAVETDAVFRVELAMPLWGQRLVIH